MEGEETEQFEVAGGLEEVCALSTLLFDIALEWIMRRVPEEARVKLSGITFGRLAYVHDVDMMIDNLVDLDSTVRVSAETATRVFRTAKA